MAKLTVSLCCVLLIVRTTIAQYGYNTNIYGGAGAGGYPNYNGYGYGGYPSYGYQQNPSYGYYPYYGYYPSYGGGYQQGGYPYYSQNQNQLGYNPNSYYGNGLNQAYASSQGGTATAQATAGGGGYFG